LHSTVFCVSLCCQRGKRRKSPEKTEKTNFLKSIKFQS
jgi:hypothetical protein